MVLHNAILNYAILYNIWKHSVTRGINPSVKNYTPPFIIHPILKTLHPLALHNFSWQSASLLLLSPGVQGEHF